MPEAVPDARLTLLAQSSADLPPLSALLQDATLRIADIGFDPRRRRLALLVNRYRWEAATPSRVRAALRLETVTAVQRQGWPRDPDTVLGLLNLTQVAGRLQLIFAGGTALRVDAEAIEIVLEDIAPAWPTRRIPRHAI